MSEVTDLLQLDFLLALFRPLLTINESAFLADCSPDHITGLIDEGRLRAIDISAAGDRRCPRIYRYTVEHLLIAPHKKMAVVPAAQILQHTRPTLLKREIAQILACTERHVANLALPCGEISLGSMARCPRYSRDGFIRFLTDREIV